MSLFTSYMATNGSSQRSGLNFCSYEPEPKYEKHGGHDSAIEFYHEYSKGSCKPDCLTVGLPLLADSGFLWGRRVPTLQNWAAHFRCMYGPNGGHNTRKNLKQYIYPDRSP